MMQLNADGNFVGSGVFKSDDPLGYARAIVAATTYFDKPGVIAEVSAGLGKPMRGLDVASMPKEELLTIQRLVGRPHLPGTGEAAARGAAGGLAVPCRVRSDAIASR